jgi:hypothetical protein
MPTAANAARGSAPNASVELADIYPSRAASNIQAGAILSGGRQWLRKTQFGS